MSYLDQILERRGIATATPFWKLRVTDDELTGLVEYIRTEVSRIPCGLPLSKRKKMYSSFDREACLLYALWWGRKYDGDAQSWGEPLDDFGIDDRYLDYIREAVLEELKWEKQLNIVVYRSEGGRNMYLQSLLAQGGLPMGVMDNNDNITSFENYLYNLITEYERLDMCDWTDITAAKILAGRYLNNSTLCNSDAVIDFSLEIVRAYICNDNTAFADYQEIQDIISRIRERRGNRQRQERRFFKVAWEIKPGFGDFELLYSVSAPHEVFIDNADNDVNVVSYYVAGRIVGAYHRKGDRFLLMPGTAMSGKVKWNNQQGHLVLQRKKNDVFSEESSLINSMPPFLNEPLLLQYCNGTWIPKQNHNNDTYACLMPCEWKCCEIESNTIFTYEEKQYKWFEVDWNKIETGVLHFVNTLSGEQISLDRTISDYSVSFVPRLPEWLEVSSIPVVVNNNDLKQCFRYFHDDQPVSSNGFRFLYKLLGSTEYRRYTTGVLPSGLIMLKIEFPEGNQSRTFSFYNISGLDVCREGNDILRISYTGGKYVLLAGQDVILVGDNLYKVANPQDVRALSPVMFRFYPIGAEMKSIELGFSSPIQQCCFMDNDGRILNREYPISFSELHNCKLNLSESKRIVLSYYEQTENNLTCVTRKEISMRPGRYTLDVFKDDIERLVLINGFNDHKKFTSIKITGTQSEVKIRRNAFKARQFLDEDGKVGIIVHRNQEPVSGLQLHAIAVGVSPESPLYRSDELRLVGGTEPGRYYLPEMEYLGAEEFVVFSENTEGVGNMLPFFLNVKGYMTKEKRDENKRDTIEQIKQRLLEGDEQEWKNTWFYMDLVIKYRLSYFNSFNTFFAVANSPYLLSEFLVRVRQSELYYRYGNATIVSELQRMEKDMAFRFHYLPYECWRHQSAKLGDNYDRLVAQIPKLKETLGDKISYINDQISLLKDLLINQFGEKDGVEIYLVLVVVGMNELIVNGGDLPEFARALDYYTSKAGDAMSEFNRFTVPNDLRVPTVDYHPFRALDRYRPDQVLQKLQYLTIVLPQSAAQYVQGVNMELWQHRPDSTANEFLRRMINYISIYAPEAYNELFKTSLSRPQVNQNRN